MTQSDAAKAIDRALDSLARELEEGRSQAMETYLRTMRRFRQTYSWGNTLLIWLQCPDATHVAGFSTWKSLGRYVRKGEKGIQILAPCVYRRDDEDGEEQVARYFRAVYVFDVAQTDGQPLPEPPRVTGDPGSYFERLEAFVSLDLGVRIEYPVSLGRSHGRCRDGLIEVVDSLATGHKFAVLTHETAHHLLHVHAPEELRRDRGLIELQAEAVAHAVCESLGLETNHAGADYIALYGGDKARLRQSLAAIHQAAGRILTAIADTAPAERRKDTIQAPTPEQRARRWAKR